MRNLGLCGKPVGQQSKLINRNVTALDALQQVSPQVSRKAFSLDARHG